MQKLSVTPILFLFCIVITGFIMRVWNLSTVPVGFFCDEAATGYNAYTLLTRGTDEYGKPFPILFESFGNWRPGIPFYWTIPFVALFGLNEWSVRLAPAMIGTLTIIATYSFASLLFRSQWIGLWSALFLALSPWHIHFSRYAGENIYLPFFLTLTSATFLAAIQKKSSTLLLLSSLGFGLALYTYFPAYFIVPLFLLLFCVIYKKNILLFVGFFVIMIPLLTYLPSGKTTGRFTQVAVSFRNRSPTQALSAMARTYIDHFSPNFLFAKGDIGYKTHFITRFSVRGMGELYWMQLPLILIGLWAIWKNKRASWVIGFWLLTYPLGSTVVPFADGGGPFATRSIIGVIPFQILTAIGIDSLMTRLKYIRTVVLAMILIVTGVSVGKYVREYFIEYPQYSSDFWGWQFGPRDIMQYFLAHKDSYDEFLLVGNFNAPEIFLRFYDPQNSCQHKCKIGDGTKIDPAKKQLFAIGVDRQKEFPMNQFKSVQTIYYPNGSPAFLMGTFIQPAI